MEHLFVFTVTGENDAALDAQADEKIKAYWQDRGYVIAKKAVIFEAETYMATYTTHAT